MTTNGSTRRPAPRPVLACGHPDPHCYTSKPMYYDRRGRTICLDCWVTRFEPEDKRVAIAILGKGSDHEMTVSTVWLGLDHQYGSGPPLIFETMVFAGHTLSDRYCERYTTEEQALQGHDRIVQDLRDGTLEVDAE